MIIDTSYHKGELNLEAIATSGVVANIQKVSDGFFLPIDFNWTYDNKNHIDITFQLYWKQLRNHFTWRGGYHFLRVDDELAVQRGRPTSPQQIDLFVEALNKEGLEWDDYVVLDVEQIGAEMNSVNARQVGDRTKAAVLRLENQIGRKPIIYTGAWWWERYHHAFDNEFFKEYPFWLSHYWPIDANNQMYYNGSVYYLKYNRCFPRSWRDDINDRIAYCRVPAINGVATIPIDNVLLWQYAERGKIPGTNNKNIDVNIEIIPEEEWSMARGEEPAPPPPPPPPPIDPEPEPQTCRELLLYILKLITDFFTQE